MLYKEVPPQNDVRTCNINYPRLLVSDVWVECLYTGDRINCCVLLSGDNDLNVSITTYKGYKIISKPYPKLRQILEEKYPLIDKYPDKVVGDIIEDFKNYFKE